ncbi:rhodanese-like domain-containing protein [Pseudoprimorskyibacter insulae]|uniref:Thiosulfate sulfurtransferase PspE n=1 Tax=Pseudoprimorskyibacter insulae TaxID=1695997 RepID=A0A2R8AXJ8_9RHOB|nr:rhodanese-like domain-containing protein [Pseudoprimorskyibacter insulae]SPF80775.1 Thiosulfate sulfurtransferase PspE [Pseudoprimorskyibacter insulae]
MFAMFSNTPARPTYTAADAVRDAADGKIELIDIRDPMELAGGRAEGSVNVPLATLSMRADPRSPECMAAFKSGKPIVLYCASGGRASMAQGMLEQMGHAEVHNIGGLAHWYQAGGQIAR